MSWKLRESVDIANQSAALMVGSFDCDSDSNVFFMPPAGRSLPSSIVRISADGRKATPFSLASVPGFDKAVISAYSVGLDDRVYVLAAKDDDGYVVTFDKDGQFGSASKLEVVKGSLLMRIGVTARDLYFIGGAQRKGEKKIRSEINAIFDSHGQVVASVELGQARIGDGDINISDPPIVDTDRMARDQKLQDLVDLSIVRGAEDGNFYFSRFEAKGPIFVVSPAGQVVRQIRLVPPKDPGSELLDIKLSKGRLAVGYEGEPPAGGTAPVTIDVYDAQTGDFLAQYHHENWQIGTAWACFSPDSFTFISSDENGKMRLVKAGAN